MKTGIIIQARMGSERLPGKVLRDIGGKSLLQTLIDRIRPCGLPIVVATTTNPKDDVLAAKAKEMGTLVFRGDETDVLDRFYQCSQEHGFEAVIRLTADNPFVDAGLIGKAMDLFTPGFEPGLYLFTSGYPLGISLEVFSAAALAEAWSHARDPKEREHVTPYIYNNPATVTKELEYSPDKSTYRLTIDTEKDEALAITLVTEYHADQLGVDEIIWILDRHPKLRALNTDVYQKKWND
jgi:spore coat polysaccharide biosynthesis protein SpsF